MKYISSYWIFLLIFFILAGCQSNKGEFVHKSESELAKMEESSQKANEHFVNGQLRQAEKIITKLSKEKTVSQTLYQLEHLSLLLLDNRHAEAHKLMMNLHKNFEMLFDKKLEEKAQSIWHGEVNKVYKGDSYERATFYAFMALSFIEQGNYEDAIRSVKNGLLADADSNKEEAIDDYALLHYLGFFASRKMGQTEEAFEYLRGMNRALQLRGCEDQQFLESLAKQHMVLFDKQHPNVLLTVWTGTPPTVVCLGRYKEKRSIIHGKMLFDALQLSINAKPYISFTNNLGDIDFQATTRGGRLMDNILADKAAAKLAMSDMHGAFTIVGLYLMYYGLATMPFPPLGISFLGAGLGCCIIGGTVHIIGSFMNPEADARYWKNLPGQLYIIPLHLPPGTHKIMLAGLKHSDRAGSALFNIEVPHGEKVNVFHLPMMKTGLNYNSAFIEKFKEEQAAAVSKSASQRMSGEIK